MRLSTLSLVSVCSTVVVGAFVLQERPEVEAERLELCLSPSESLMPRRHPRGQQALTNTYLPYEGGLEAAELVFPGGASRGIPTRNDHHHNGYWGQVPLYTALANGVRSIEADVWLNPNDQKLYVGHSAISLTRARTFSHLYVDQLVKLLEDANPRDEEYDFFKETNFVDFDNVVEERRPVEPWFDEGIPIIQLVIDLKTRGDETYHAVVKELEPLRKRDWLSKWNGTHLIQGPVQAVLTGNGFNHDVRAIVPTLDIIDVFIDAPLLSLKDTWTGIDGKSYTWNSTFAPLASAGFHSVTSWNGTYPITQDEMRALRQVFSIAQALGFKTRAYSPPRWPTYVRDRVWKTLYEAGTDFMDADELEDIAKF